MLLALALFLAAAPLARAAEAPPTVAELLAKLPAKTVAEGQQVLAQIVRLGPAGTREVVNAIAAPGAGDDSRARFALNGLAYYVTRPRAERERKALSAALIERLNSDADPQAKAFLISTLQLCGKGEAIAPLAALLGDAALGGPAARALVRIGGRDAVAALAKALPAVPDANRPAILQALGDLRDRSAVPAILPYATSEDTNTRRTALYAVAVSGDPAASPVLLNASRAAGTYERAHATALLLTYARRCAEMRDGKGCAALCRALIGPGTPPREVNVVCDALSVLVAAEGKRALPDLLAALDSESKPLREAALKLTQKLSGKDVTAALVAKAKTAPAPVRAEIVAALGRRGDRTALPAVLAALQDEDPGVRLAAVGAAERFATREAIAGLIVALDTDQADQAKAAQAALARIPGAALLAAAAAALPKAGAPGRVGLLQVLAARGARAHLEAIFAATADPEASVRIAALKALARVGTPADAPRVIALIGTLTDEAAQEEAQAAAVALCRRAPEAAGRAEPFLAALAPATGPTRSLFLAALAELGGANALQAVLTDARSADAKTQDAAVRALAEWEDPAAAPELLNVARQAQNPTHQALALRGFVRLAGQGPAPQRVRMYQDALAVAKRPEEKRLVLGGLSAVRHLDALKTVAPLLDDPALAAEAALAAVTIAIPEDAKQEPLRGPEVEAVLVKAAKDPALRARIQTRLTLVPPADAEGFVPLFNGRDLAGWIGATKGCAVEGDTLVCLKEGGGNLYTAWEYDSFVFRFDFRFGPGANNGVGIRVPPRGDGAYSGMEIQILDDTADVYKSLKPYQYHGSIYGVAPAKRGFLKPVGEWNTEEITANGRHITVKLNGEVIVDADIDQASTPQTADGRPHPGLKNTQGHIGFLGHGHRIEFRNLKVKELR